MADNNDIASVVVGNGGPTVAYQTTAITVTVVEAQSVGMVGVPIPEQFSVLQVETPGIQGPQGDQNVYTGPTPPANPEIGWVWIQTP